MPTKYISPAIGALSYYALGFLSGVPIGYYVWRNGSLKGLAAINAASLVLTLTMNKFAGVGGLEDVLLLGTVLGGVNVGAGLSRLNSKK
ncbi:MAG: hypothetical protein HYT16_01800 [DPANN group archaeon]|nr:hypothetical protein [DPANN group archaeon]